MAESMGLSSAGPVVSRSRLLFWLLAAIGFATLQPAQAVNGRPSGALSEEECALGALGDESIVSPLRIAAIFIILASSTTGVVLPFLPQWASSNKDKTSRSRRIWDETFFILKYAGAGVIIATAFVHLTYESFVQLNSPCLNLAYEPLAPVLFMASLSLVFLVDCFLTRYIHRLRKAAKTNTSTSPRPTFTNDEELQAATAAVATTAKFELDEEESGRSSSSSRESSIDEKSRELEVMIIEGGIVFHSVMVGLGLGTSPEEGFVPLFIAITFHQFFDGVAIGTRMALLNFVGRRRKQIAMFAAYGLVTPIGISIGVLVRRSFQPNDPRTILAIGVLDSLSAGVLLYGALVNLLAKDFLAGEMLEVSDKRLGVALASLFVGAVIMSLLGQWA